MDPHRIGSLLRACSSAKLLKHGEVLHQKAVVLGLQHHPLVCPGLVNFYVTCGLLRSALHVFESAEDVSDVSIWNSLLAAYSRNRLHKEAIVLFDRLRHSRLLSPDGYTYPSVLKAYAGLGYGREGRKVHALVVKSGCVGDVVVSSSLIGMYAKCGLFAPAVELFDEMTGRDTASWNNVISCYHQDGQARKALEVFERMKSSGFDPDSVTFTTVFSACARLLAVDYGKKVHTDMVKSGFQIDGFVRAALVDMYGKCGCLEDARVVFERAQTKGVVLWNSIIGGYSANGDCRSCVELFVRMEREGIDPTSTTLSSLLISCSKSCDLLQGKFIHGYILRREVEVDIFVVTSLIDLYFKCGSVDTALSIFESMRSKNVVLWNVVISGYVTVGDYFCALKTYDAMKTFGVKADAITFTSVLSACSQLAALEQGKEVHRCVVEGKLEANDILMSALLDMYAKCGAVDDARKIFNQLPVKDVVSWTSMITAYGSHGRATEALKLFRELQKSDKEPDRVCFLSVISACSHGGLVNEGCYFFDEMKHKYKMVPTLEHYSCLIDLLGRSGRLQEAYDVLQEMPSMKKDVGVLGSLFSACCWHKNLELGEKIARLLIEMEPDDLSSYIIMSNMYAAAGSWDEVRKIRGRIRNKRLKKNPGCSWIEIDKRIHQFFVEDFSHPMSDKIYGCVDDLVCHMEDKEHQFQDEGPKPT